MRAQLIDLWLWRSCFCNYSSTVIISLAENLCRNLHRCRNCMGSAGSCFCSCSANLVFVFTGSCSVPCFSTIWTLFSFVRLGNLPRLFYSKEEETNPRSPSQQCGNIMWCCGASEVKLPYAKCKLPPIKSEYPNNGDTLLIFLLQ